jgi:hypothetical protein
MPRYLYGSTIYHPLRLYNGKIRLRPQEGRIGSHTYFVFLGHDEIMVSGCNACREKGVPEGAILLVESDEVRPPEGVYGVC